MKRKKTPDLKQAGTLTADEALRAIGDDPETLLLAISILDRMHARRGLRRANGISRSRTKYRLTS